MSEFYNTNASDSGTIVRRVGEGNIQWGRGVKPTAPDVYPQLIQGQFVRLDTTTGEIIPTTASNQACVGFVITPNTALNGQRATIQTQGGAIITTATSAGAVTAGVYVVVIGNNTNVTPNRPNSDLAVSGNYAQGISLTAAAAIDNLQEVLVLTTSVLIP